MKKTKSELKIRNFIMLTLAGLINAVGVTLLLAPVNLYDSGVSGLSMFLNSLTPDWLQLWMFLVVINLPIFLFGFKSQGLAFTVYSIYAIVIYSLFAAVFENTIDFSKGSPFVDNDLLLCAIFGGALSGIGSGITIRYGGALDGIEQLAVIFAKKLNLTVGNFVLIFNIALYLIIGITKQSFILPLYSIIAYFIGSKVIDFISQGLDQAKGALIITSHCDTVAAALSTEFGRGLTILDGKGYYSQSDKHIIYCVVNRFQVAKLRNAVAATDKYAFVTIMDITDVFGTSIKYSHENDKRIKQKLMAIKEQQAKQEKELKEKNENAQITIGELLDKD